MSIKLKPIIILFVLLIITVIIVYLGLNDEQRKNILSFEDPLKVQQDKENAQKEPEKVQRPIEEILESVNKSIEDTNNIFLKVYKNNFLYKSNIRNFGIDNKNNVFVDGDDYYADLSEKVVYFLDNGKWYKRELTEDITLDKNDYKIPSTAKQVEDERVDGAECFVFKDDLTNKKYYIKKSTETIFCVSETIENDIFYYQISFKEITINEKIKKNALLK